MPRFCDRPERATRKSTPAQTLAKTLWNFNIFRSNLAPHLTGHPRRLPSSLLWAGDQWSCSVRISLWMVVTELRGKSVTKEKHSLCIISEGLFWGVVQCDLVEKHWCFGRTCWTSPTAFFLPNSSYKPILPVIYIIFLLYPPLIRLRFLISSLDRFDLTPGFLAPLHKRLTVCFPHGWLFYP